MASPDVLQAQLRELREQRNQALQDGDSQSVRELDQEISNIERALKQAESENIPANARFVGKDTQTGGFIYQNRATGERFLSTREPSAAQRAEFDAANPRPPPEPQPAQSASQQVSSQTNQAPQPLPSADQSTTGDTGTDDPVKTVEQTQAITTASRSGVALQAPATGASAEGDVGEAEARAAVLTQGQGAKDDAGGATSPTAAVNATETIEPNIKPRANILDEFASYTYSASVYMLSTEQYEQILRTSNKRVDGYNLLFQSGGAANNRGGPRAVGEAGSAAPGAADAGRNPFFDNDFYIDSIEFTTLPMGKGTNAVHNTSALKFTVVEPNGITLLDRLYDAVANFEPRSATGTVNYTAVAYLMVMRFYGYDSMGKAVQIRNRQYDAEGVSDPQAVVEKFIPFRINSINWSVSSRLVTYEWECTPIGQQIAGYSARGTIPYDIQLTETTVEKLLSGPAKFRLDSLSEQNREAREAEGFSEPPAKANAAPTDKKTLSQGLAEAMNQYQAALVQRGIYTYPDVYEIEFVGPGSEKIKDAILKSASLNPIAQTASGQAATQDPNGLRPGTNAVDKNTKKFAITAGQQMLQVIDLVIRNSSYVYNQASIITNQDGTESSHPDSRNQPVKWYNISMQAERIGNVLDPKRNDYPYRIKYVISPFVVKNLDSVYFPVTRFSGVHKSYPYWFTGQNIAVLDYSEKLNSLYHLTISGAVPGDSNAARNRERYTASLADIIKYAYAPRSSESSAGAQGKTNELAANAAESLFSPGDIGEATIKIVGDPDWIQQGTIFRGANERSLNPLVYNTGFLPDGSISFDSQDILFEIVWKRPNDYDIATGLANPYARSAARYNNYSAEQSRVYHCKKVVSEFRQGRFEQTLHGALYLFPKPDQTNTANPAAAAGAQDDATGVDAAVAAQAGRNSAGVGGNTKAAAAGAQTLSALIKAPLPFVGTNNGLTTYAPLLAGVETTVPQLTQFFQAQPLTSGTNTAVASVVFQTPSRLPAADPSLGRLTNVQVQDLVNQQGSNVNNSPTSVNNPANQQGVREA